MDSNTTALYSEPVFVERSRRPLDTGVVGGLAIGTFLILITILVSGEVSRFINPLGFTMVLGGTIASTMIQFSLPELHTALLCLRNIIYAREQGALERVLYFVELSQRIRREGMLVLDQEASQLNDLFLAKALELTVDGTEPESMRRMLENELRSSLDHQAKSVAIFQTMASYAPAFGLIGTLIGLVTLLGSLNTPESVGPAMSVAFISTLYGALFANFVCMPIAGKLKMRGDEEALIKTISIEGALSLARGDNPILVEQHLQGFLPSA